MIERGSWNYILTHKMTNFHWIIFCLNATFCLLVLSWVTFVNLTLWKRKEWCGEEYVNLHQKRWIMPRIRAHHMLTCQSKFGEWISKKEFPVTHTESDVRRWNQTKIKQDKPIKNTISCIFGIFYFPVTIFFTLLIKLNNYWISVEKFYLFSLISYIINFMATFLYWSYTLLIYVCLMIAFLNFIIFFILF